VHSLTKIVELFFLNYNYSQSEAKHFNNKNRVQHNTHKMRTTFEGRERDEEHSFSENRLTRTLFRCSRRSCFKAMIKNINVKNKMANVLCRKNVK